MHRGFKNLYLIFIFFALFVQSGISDIIKVDEKTQKVGITASSELFIDDQSHFSYEDVSQNTFGDNFKPSNSTSVSSNGARETIWLRFNIVNSSSNTFFGKLEMPIVWLNKAEVYLRFENLFHRMNLFGNSVIEKNNINRRKYKEKI